MKKLKEWFEKKEVCHFPKSMPPVIASVSSIETLSEARQPQVLYILKRPLLRACKDDVPKNRIFFLTATDLTQNELEDLAGKMQNHSFYSAGASDPDTLVRDLIQAFDYDQLLSAFTGTLSEAFFGGASIQELTELSLSVIKNPVFVFDAAFKLIAAAPYFESLDAHSRQIIDEGGFTDYDFDFVNHYLYERKPLHEQVKKSSLPVLATDEKLGRQRLILCFDTDRDVGHLVISDFYKPIESIDYDYLVILRNFIYEKFQQSEFNKNTSGFPYEFFLSDLLDKKVSASTALQSRFAYVSREFSRTLYCIVIETARSFHTINIHRVRNEMESLFPSLKTLLYQGQIVGILSNKEDQWLGPADYGKLRRFCETQGLFCGISNIFDSIFDLSDYYKQALRAIELGVCHFSDPGLYIYEDFFMDHIHYLIRQGESAQVLCSPWLKRLIRYDKKHETELAHTLFIYLQCERNTTSTAAQLFVHRNTLINRLKKIASLVPYEDMTAKERLYYIISYGLMLQ